MRVEELDYELPEERIAQRPLEARDASRLMVVPLSGAPFEHRTFRELPELLGEGDLLVVNDARVVPARLLGHKVPSGGRVEALLTEALGEGEWRAVCGSSKPLKVGGRVSFAGTEAEVVAVEGEGVHRLRFDLDEAALLSRLEAGLGVIPLPPYIRRDADDDDRHRYQTVFADRGLAVAAPTAGLHFTGAVLEALEARGVVLSRVTLHVGPGTFLPIRSERVEDHRMHEEAYEVPAATAHAVARTRAGGGRVLAVGTTALRTLEAAWEGQGVRPGPGRTDLFVHPGYRFRAVDGLLTNFHLPRSTLLLLVAALAGKDRILSAYREAVERGYRFFSYGDAMLLA